LTGKSSGDKVLSMSLSVLTAFGLGLAIRLLLASYANLNLDEGNQIYGARLLLYGLAPYRDFAVRAVPQTLVIAGFIKLFGESILSGRMVSVFFSSLTILYLFSIGKELYGYRVGVISAFFYSLSPFVVYTTYIVKTEPVQAYFVAVAFHLLLLAQRRRSMSASLVGGSSLGLAVLIRPSAGIYIVTLPVLYYALSRRLRLASRSLLYFGVSAITVFALSVVYFVSLTDISWMSRYFGPGAVEFYAFLEPTIGSYTREKILSAAVIMAPYLTFPTLIFLGLLARPHFNGHERLFAFSIVASVATVLYALWAWWELPPNYSYGLLPVNNGYVLLTYLILVLITAASYNILSKPRSLSALPYANAFIMWWLSSIIAFYVIIKLVWFLDYFAEITPVLSITGAVAVSNFLDRTSDRPKREAISYAGGNHGAALRPAGFVFLSLLLLSSLPAISTYLTVENPNRDISMSTVTQVGAYIKSRTTPTERIFTFNAILAVESNRRIVLDNLYGLAYLLYPPDRPLSYDPYNLVPGQVQIVQTIRGDLSVTYALIDGRTKAILGHLPMLADFIATHFEKEITLGDVEIRRRIGQEFVLNNSIRNPGFEAGTLFGWKVYSIGGGSTSVTRVLSKEGIYSAMVCIEEVNSTVVLYQDIGHFPGNSTAVSFWIRIPESASLHVYVSVQIRNKAGQVVGSRSTRQIARTSDWYLASLSLNMPTDGEMIRVLLVVSGDGGCAYLDG